jgi:hypothetical protein
LLASSALAVGQQAVVAFDFVCNGSKTGPCPDGASPNSLIQASDGNFYGTAANSGDKAGGLTRFGGTVFSLTPAGKFTLLHTFVPGANNKFANGSGPISLTEGPDGKLYGITVEGGNNPGIEGFYGYGVLFRINKTGSGFQVVHKFCSVGVYCADGVYSAGSLLVGTDGNTYGLTSQGGGGAGCQFGGCGTIFRVTPSSGAYQVVFSFSSASGGGFPSGMIPAADGTFYGLSAGGLFHYTPATGTFQLTALPFPFPTGCPGLACFATSVFAFGPNGNLYGFYTVYDSTDTGLYEVRVDGSNLQLFPPLANGIGTELLLASDGNLWFPQSSGSGSSLGDIVTVSPSTGTVIQTLTPFSQSVSNPAVIIEAADGTLWGVGSGVINQSGHFGGGTIFNLNAGLPPR